MRRNRWIILLGAITILALSVVIYRPVGPIDPREVAPPVATPAPDAVSGFAHSLPVPLDEFYQSVPRDAIPDIDAPKYDSPATSPWEDDDRVLGISAGDEAWAYPIKILNWHEIVNDDLAGTPIAITYCPLCGTGIAFDRRLQNGDVITFGNSGKLFMNDLVMYDDQTGSLWVQVAGQAISGSLTGQTLDTIPITHSTWGEWRSLHPNTLVLSTDTGFTRNYSNDPFEAYERNDSIGATGGRVDPRLEGKDRVIGVATSDASVAVTIKSITNLSVVNTALSKDKIVITYDPRSGMSHAFVAMAKGEELTFQADDRFSMKDVETGSTWSTITGEAVSGSLSGSVLIELTATQAFWFAWSDFHPSSILLY